MPVRRVTLPARADGATRRDVTSRIQQRTVTGVDGRAAGPAGSAHRSRDARHGRDVTHRRVGRAATGASPGGETTIVINDVRRPRRGHGEHRVALTGCGLPCRATRSNRDFLLAITGIIAHKNQFRATSARRECITS